MERIGFKMKLLKDCAAEYKRRHDAIWPELSALLSGIGIRQYSIFLDETSGILFGYLQMEDPALLDKLREEPLMWKWWNYMADIMDSNPDHSPSTAPLQEVFYLP
jgi:L-rhamnose mutarotase